MDIKHIKEILLIQQNTLLNISGLNVQCLDDSKNIIDQEYTGQIKSFATSGQTATLEFTTDKSPSSFNVEAEYSIKGE